MTKRKGFENATEDIWSSFSYLEEYGFHKNIIKDEGWISLIVYESYSFKIFLQYEYISGHFGFNFYDKTDEKQYQIWEYLQEIIPDFSYKNYKPDEFGNYKYALTNISEDFKKNFIKDFILKK